MVIWQKYSRPAPKRRQLKLNGTPLNSQFVTLRPSRPDSFDSPGARFHLLVPR